METTKKTASGGTLLTILLLLASSLMQAQEKGKFLNEKPEDLISDEAKSNKKAIFGVLIFVISKIAAKYNKEEDTSNKKASRSYSHRHHHHHKVIKKSA